MSCNAGDNASKRHLQHGHSGLIVLIISFSPWQHLHTVDVELEMYNTSLDDFNLQIVV